MRDVYIIGTGLSQFGEVWRKSLRELFVDAGMSAMKDSGVDHLDSLYVGCMSGGMFVGQEHIGALCADYLGLQGVPAMRVESACASGGMAVRAAFFEVASGAADIVMAAGVEKMTDCDGDDQQKPFGDELVKGRNAEQVHAVRQGRARGRHHRHRLVFDPGRRR